MSSDASCPAPGQQQQKKPTSAAVGSEHVSYAQLAEAIVQPLDLTSSANPLPELAPVPLATYLREDAGAGAVVYLVRRPG
jgi:hypothetical protein